MAEGNWSKTFATDVYDKSYNQNQHQLNTGLVRQDVTNFEDFDSQQIGSRFYFIRNRSGVPSSSWNYAPGLLFKPSSTESFYIIININDSKIAILRKTSNTWDTTWKYLTPA